MSARIAVLRGDGVGPEVVNAALRVLRACVEFEERPALVGGAAIDATGEPLPQATIEQCRESDAVFLGAVGGPAWENSGRRAEEGILGLRKALSLWANLRPARYMGLPTPLRENLARHADLLVVRDLAGGVYFGEPRGTGETEAWNTWRQTTEQTRRVAHVAFKAARQRASRVTSVDKANVLEASRLWRAAVIAVAAEYPDVALEHRYIDAMSFEMLAAPQRFDVIVADNLFGDILSDEAAAVTGSIGLLPSASLGDGTPLFEPVHGSAPTIAGRGIANPVGAILSAAMLLEYALGRPDLGRQVESAVTLALGDCRTPDIGGTASTADFTSRVLLHLEAQAWFANGEVESVPDYGWGV
jgi:3-isopropylmalate dehydrogenase